MQHIQEFDQKVALEAILYLADKSASPTFHHIAKLLYFADRMHLERYGRFICGDRYVAMKHGPVPSGVYDMIKAAQNGVQYLCFPEAEGAFDVVGKYTVKPRRHPDVGWFSSSDLACLDEALRKYDKYTFEEMTRMSHDSAWRAADENDFISIEAIVASLGNPSGLLEHLANQHP